MGMHESGHGDPRLAPARRRWRAAGDRIWAVATADDAGYRQAVTTIGPLLDELRRSTATAADLLDLDEDPAPLLARLSEEAAGVVGRQPILLAAACAIRADELIGPWAAEYELMRAGHGSRLDTRSDAGSDR